MSAFANLGWDWVYAVHPFERYGWGWQRRRRVCDTCGGEIGRQCECIVPDSVLA